MISLWCGRLTCRWSWRSWTPSRREASSSRTSSGSWPGYIISTRPKQIALYGIDLSVHRHENKEICKIMTFSAMWMANPFLFAVKQHQVRTVNTSTQSQNNTKSLSALNTNECNECGGDLECNLAVNLNGGLGTPAWGSYGMQPYFTNRFHFLPPIFLMKLTYTLRGQFIYQLTQRCGYNCTLCTVYSSLTDVFPCQKKWIKEASIIINTISLTPAAVQGGRTSPQLSAGEGDPPPPVLLAHNRKWI